jgi:hypothetical protein
VPKVAYWAPEEEMTSLDRVAGHECSRYDARRLSSLGTGRIGCLVNGGVLLHFRRWRDTKRRDINSVAR